MDTGLIIKISDVTDTPSYFNDSLMLLITKRNTDTFSFVIIVGDYVVEKYTVMMSLEDYAIIFERKTKY